MHEKLSTNSVLISFELIGSNWPEVHKQLCEILADTPEASVLKVSGKHQMTFYQYYLHDFLRSIHQVTHNMAKKEYEV